LLVKTVAVDTGGTFTDMVVMDQETGEIEILKVPSTPSDPSQSIVEGVLEMFPNKGDLDNIGTLSHGTTVGTNILVQNKGAKVGLLITEGFTGINDIWHLPRFGAELGNLFIEKKPLVPPRFRFEVPERIDNEGNVLKPLDEQATIQAIRRLKEKGVEAIAVVLLFSFLNPAHEKRVGELIKQEYPEAWVSLSSEILPQIREHPRYSTTVANARLDPAMTAYLTNLSKKLHDEGVTTRQLYIMQSNGGVNKVESVVPVTTILSGPCAGALAGVEIASAAGFDNVVTLDVGGTSTDIALGEKGKILEETSGRLGDWELGVPMLMIHTIGAGGGTIAWLDKGGGLQVGPHSAGADPGPVCYGKGGTNPTVTDANVVLGYLNPSNLGGGKVSLHYDMAYEAIKDMGATLGLSPLQTAEGIIRIINAKMEEGVRAVSTERGYDLRYFSMVAFGGAGPIPSGRMAADLNMQKVIVPPAPGVTSALGLLMADPRRDYVTSRLVPLAGLTGEAAMAVFSGLETQALEGFQNDGFPREQIQLSRFLDLRYQGQGYELTVPVSGAAHLTEDDLKTSRANFDQLHAQQFGHGAPEEPVEVVNYRVVAVAEVRHASINPGATGEGGVETARVGDRDACFSSAQGMSSCPVYDRALLRPGHRLEGPAIVDQSDSTTVIYPGQLAEVDGFGNIIITVN
jgi:N-methylhydantoinase A